jgi:hypothetical protein
MAIIFILVYHENQFTETEPPHEEVEGEGLISRDAIGTD